ncbi:MAG: hypothetical protein CM15mP19_12180 [Gammaproteobacteria bacterium]|nr:MAG: hypothetical protein CM15mP19_12180 [Gammaproteobacteria bacterium]
MRNIFKELTFKLTQLNKHQKVLFISFIDSIILFASWSLFYILPVVLYTKSELGFLIIIKHKILLYLLPLL